MGRGHEEEMEEGRRKDKLTSLIWLAEEDLERNKGREGTGGFSLKVFRTTIVPKSSLFYFRGRKGIK